MTLRNEKLSDQSGSTLVEVMVSALLMITIAISVFAALEATGRAGAQERHRARAFSIAQDDQARMRSLKVSEITRLNETRTVVQDGITYTIVSTGAPKIDRTATAACDSGNSSADYVAISTKVTWSSIGSRPPVIIESLVAPPNGTLDSTRGALGVSVVDRDSQPYAGITITGSGAGTFSGTTTDTGCVIFGDLPVGNYNVTAATANVVDADGLAPTAMPTSVVAGSSNTLSLQYDKPSGFTVGFKRISSGSTVTAMNYDRIRVFNTGMTQTRSFGTAGTFAPTVKATGLFPFTSAYAVYAGACDANTPPTAAPTGSAPLYNYSVPVGQTAPTGANFSLQLPSLNLTAYRGTAASGTGSSGADIEVVDENCPEAGTRLFKTTSVGKISETATPSVAAFPGLPYGEYDICVSGPSSSGTRRLYFDSVDLFSASSPAVVNAPLRNGSTGTC